MKITFHGAAGQVTGSKHLLALKNGKNILLDCGFFQGRGKESAQLNQHFGFDPMSVDYLILSHAHIDHSGNIPKLVKDGFKGKIICTPATFDLCSIMLMDSAYIQEQDAFYINKHRIRDGKKPIEPLYNKEDAAKALEFFQPLNYNTLHEVCEGVKLKFTDAGHILGSAVVNLTINEKDEETHKICFTGDIGRYIKKILKQPQAVPQADTLICESTYGDRIHETVTDANEKLLRAVVETCVVKKGKLIVPAFSVGKTQELVFALNKLEFEGKLPKIKVFVDSPLAVNATDIIKSHPECYSDSTHEFMKEDPDPFGFNNLHYIRDVNDSKAINNLKEPCIVISASGMADAGRVKHHLVNTIEDSRNSILFIGYCEPSSLGGRILRGDTEVRIYGQPFKVNADVYRIDFFSAHGDQSELLRFVANHQPDLTERVFLVHGDQEALNQMQQKLNDKGYREVIIPALGQGFYL